MPDEKCSHNWEMVNVAFGFIITEKCFQCDKIATYFSFEQKPPLEEYREGDHFWNVMESSQSFRFDLTCQQCGTTVKFDELCGLMMCTGCDDKCQVNDLLKEMESERTWIYVAFGFLPLEERKQLSVEQISVLEAYFNSRRKSSRSRIMIVSHELVRNVATCYAEVIKDVAMLSLTPPEES